MLPRALRLLPVTPASLQPMRLTVRRACSHDANSFGRRAEETLQSLSEQLEELPQQTPSLGDDYDVQLAVRWPARSLPSACACC